VTRQATRRKQKKLGLSEDAKAALDAVFARSRKLGIAYVDLLNTFRRYDRQGVDWAHFDPDTLDYGSKDAFWESLHRELAKVSKRDAERAVVDQIEQYAQQLAAQGAVAEVLKLAREVEAIDRRAAERIRALARSAGRIAAARLEVSGKRKPSKRIVYAKAIVPSLLHYLFEAERPREELASKRKKKHVDAEYSDAAAEALGRFWARAEAPRRKPEHAPYTDEAARALGRFWSATRRKRRSTRQVRLAGRRAAMAEAILALGPGVYPYRVLIAHVNRYLASKGYRPTNAVGLARVLETLRERGVYYDKHKGTVYVVRAEAGRKAGRKAVATA